MKRRIRQRQWQRQGDPGTTSTTTTGGCGVLFRASMFLLVVVVHSCWGDQHNNNSHSNSSGHNGTSSNHSQTLSVNSSINLTSSNMTNNSNSHSDVVLHPSSIVLERLRIAGLYDLTSFPDWPLHLMQFTVRLLNNKKDGWHDDVLPDALLYGTMDDSACDPDIATRAYLYATRPASDDFANYQVPAAIYGCRCSGASMAVARLAGVENIPMLSPYSSSVKLSNADEYPTFSRTAGPDNEQGQVGALVRLIRSFGWDRISVINTDTQFTKDIALELSNAWKGRHTGDDPFVGEIAYTDTIRLNATTNKVDPESVAKVLKGVPVGNPDVNSRVIVLFAHHQHSYPILKQAQEMAFQPDTIWMGVSEWIGREPIDTDVSWMPPVPGYIGLAPYRNLSSPVYKDYLARLQQYEWRKGLPLTENLHDFAADKIVDGITAFAKAFSAVPAEERRNGLLISQELRKLRFDGVSGPIAFQSNGDFLNPRFTVKTLRKAGLEWTDAGFVTPEETHVLFDKICYAGTGCSDTVPDDEYPALPSSLPFWIWIVIACLLFVCVLLFHQRRKNQSFTDKLRRIEDELKALDNNDDAVRARKGRLYKEIASLLGQPTPEHWTEHHGLVDVPPTQQEYWDVLEKLRASMNDNETCHLSQLSRVQNLGIWSYYTFRKNQLVNKYGTDMTDNDVINEISVWHGTSSLNPDVIYKDQNDGFMMQLSQQGQWGRGIYFSERSGYSDPYSFRPMTKHSDDVEGQDRELFLVRLLVGESVFLDRNEGEWMCEACRNLVTPPDNPARNGLKFDTVKGEIDDEYNTKVYVVYENGRAYPEYLVRYYKGPRDKERTPFETLDDALEGKTEDDLEESPMDSAATTQPEDEDDESSSVGSGRAVWQYEDDKDGKWVSYQEGHQIQIEQAYQRDRDGITTVEHFPWTYIIDFTVLTQTNLDHPDGTARKVRRIIVKDIRSETGTDRRGSNRTLESDNDSDCGSNISSIPETQSEGGRHTSTNSWKFSISNFRLLRNQDSGSDDEGSYHHGSNRFRMRDARGDSGGGRSWPFRINPLDSGNSSSVVEGETSRSASAPGLSRFESGSSHHTGGEIRSSSEHRMNPMDSTSSNPNSGSGNRRWYRWIHRQADSDRRSRSSSNGSWYGRRSRRERDNQQSEREDDSEIGSGSGSGLMEMNRQDGQNEHDEVARSDIEQQNNRTDESSQDGGSSGMIEFKGSQSEPESVSQSGSNLSSGCGNRNSRFLMGLQDEVMQVSTRIDPPLRELRTMIVNSPDPPSEPEDMTEDHMEEEDHSLQMHMMMNQQRQGTGRDDIALDVREGHEDNDQAR